MKKRWETDLAVVRGPQQRSWLGFIEQVRAISAQDASLRCLQRGRTLFAIASEDGPEKPPTS